MTETWKDIEDYCGCYQVSNLGRIKSLDRLIWNGVKYIQILGRIKKTKTDVKGYEVVVLSKNGREKVVKVHRLVATAFIPNDMKLPQVNHRDGNKRNNCVDNLEWCTNKENSDHAIRTGLANYETWMKSRQKKVAMLGSQGEVLQVFDSITDAAKSVGVNRGTGHISDVCNNKRMSAHGHKWSYI